MEVNPVSIQSYQQPTQREGPAPHGAEDNRPNATDTAVTITPQSETAGPKLAVRLPSGDYADFLTPEEKNALDILFSRFKNTERFGPGYQKDTRADSESVGLGNVVDVKV